MKLIQITMKENLEKNKKTEIRIIKTAIIIMKKIKIIIIINLIAIIIKLLRKNQKKDSSIKDVFKLRLIKLSIEEILIMKLRELIYNKNLFAA